jgi:hypothetical protein
MTTANALDRPRRSRVDRILVLALLLSLIPGIPGVGVETREDPATGGVLVAIADAGYIVLGTAPFLGLLASWTWPRVAAGSALVGGVVGVLLPILDLTGMIYGPPPAGMVVVNVVIAVLAAAVVWRSWRLVRGP